MIEVNKIPARTLSIKVQRANSEEFDFAIIQVDGISAHLLGWTGPDPDWKVGDVIKTIYPDVEYLSWYRVSKERLKPFIKRIDKMPKGVTV